MTNGHYIAYVRGEDEQDWMCCDDSIVRYVSLQEVLTTEPYMLFYRAVEYNVCSHPAPLWIATRIYQDSNNTAFHSSTKF